MFLLKHRKDGIMLHTLIVFTMYVSYDPERLKNIRATLHLVFKNDVT